VSFRRVTLRLVSEDGGAGTEVVMPSSINNRSFSCLSTALVRCSTLKSLASEASGAVVARPARRLECFSVLSSNTVRGVPRNLSSSEAGIASSYSQTRTVTVKRSTPVICFVGGMLNH
jgi:hypothetical protein